MTIKHDGGTEHDGRVQLDPFGFWPLYRSAIAGLGGPESGPDDAYAFHTQYVLCGSGKVTFRLHFEGLAATTGVLSVRVHRLAAGSQQADVAVIQKLSFKGLLRTGGRVELNVKAAAGDMFAVLGNIYDATDGSAAALLIDVERAHGGEAFEQKLQAARESVFGARASEAVQALLSDEPATLAEPVSQMCTSSQFDEAVYDEWVGRMQSVKTLHRKQWEFAYILQSLRHHGMLSPGMHGLGFGVGIETLPAIMATFGCTIVGTDLSVDDDRSTDWNVSNQHGATVQNLRYPTICDDAVFDRLVSYRPVDMNQIPDDLIDFDFTWSSCAYEHLGSIEAGLKFVENSLRCLRPGGLAVHTSEFNLTSNDATMDNVGTVLFRRQDYEALALRLTALGHRVAPIKYDQGNGYADAHVDVPPYSPDMHLKLMLSEYVTTSFGIMVWKGGA